VLIQFVGDEVVIYDPPTKLGVFPVANLEYGFEGKALKALIVREPGDEE